MHCRKQIGMSVERDAVARKTLDGNNLQIAASCNEGLQIVSLNGSGIHSDALMACPSTVFGAYSCPAACCMHNFLFLFLKTCVVLLCM